MRNKENPDNIVYACSDCSKAMYPRAGTFTPDEIRAATHIKANFEGEHMWITVTNVTDQGVNGTVDNEPVRPRSPKYGAKVFIVFSKIEDIA